MYSEYEKSAIITRFLTYCEKIGFGTIDNLNIVDGLPMATERSLQSIRFDKDLTKSPMNTTIDLETTQSDNGE